MTTNPQLKLLTLFTALCFASQHPLTAAEPRVDHVVIIGVDGLSPDGIHMADTPHLDRLIARGAHSFTARAVMPTSSSPNWASMIMGAGPEQHGITSNDWEPDKHELPPVTQGPGGIFPTVFAVLKDQRPEATSAVFYDWGGFGRLFEPAIPNFVEDSDGPTNAVRSAVACWKEHEPTLTFIHLDHVDHAGHHYGHGTPEYYDSVEVADRLIGEAMDGLRAAGMLDDTAVIVTSDHGGVGKGHGGATLAEVEIPWIIAGPGIREGHTLTKSINTYDTAVTAARLLGLKPHPAWTGKPVIEAEAE